MAIFSDATNLVLNDTNGVRDIFIHNRTTDLDVDGDGKTDLVWRHTNSGITAIWLLNETAIASSSFPGGVSLVWQIAGVGDVNGDGIADVVWRNGTTGTVAVWLMNGTRSRRWDFPAAPDRLGDCTDRGCQR